MADQESAFYLSALDSFNLLSTRTQISEVVLSYHEDCAYFMEKYGSSRSNPSDDKQRKWQLLREAMRNVESWSDTVHVRRLYLPLPHRHSGARFEQGSEGECQAYSSPKPLGPPLRSPAGVRTVPRLPSGFETLRVFDRQIEERLLRTNESAEDVIALAEGHAREMGGTPVWRVERRAREFITLLREEGGRDPQEIRRLTREFVFKYAGDVLPRSVMRALMAEIDAELLSQQPGAVAR